MKLKSTAYYWLAVIFGGVGMGTAMGAEGTAQTTGYISGTLFSWSLVLILAAVLVARLGFAASEKPKHQMILLSGPDTPHGQTSGRCAPKKWTTCGRCCKRSRTTGSTGGTHERRTLRQRPYQRDFGRTKEKAAR